MARYRDFGAAALSALIVIVLSSVGCTQNVADAQPAGKQVPLPATDAAPEPLPEEYQILVDKYVAALASGDQRAVDDVVDYSGLFDEIVLTVRAEDLADKRYVDGFKVGWLEQQATPLPFDLIPPTNSLCPGGVRVLTHERKDGRVHALVRVLGPNWSLPHYQTLVLGPDSMGRVRFLDVRFVQFTSSAADVIRTGIQADSPVSHDLGEIKAAFERGGLEAALQVVRRVPIDAKRDRDLAVLCVGLAFKSGIRPDIDAQLADFRTLHPTEKTLIEYITLNYYLSEQMYEEAWPLIDRLEPTLGHDPFLDVLRANLRLRQGDHAAAEKLARQALADEPQLPEVYDILLHICVANKKFGEAVAWLKAAAEKCPNIVPELSDDTTLKDFVDSSEYKVWHTKARNLSDAVKNNSRIPSPNQPAAQPKPSVPYNPTIEDKQAE